MTEGPHRYTKLTLGLIVLAGMCATPPQAVAQNVSYVRAGSFEAGPFLGISYGVDKTHALAGGNVTYAINKYILPYVEYSYFPGIARTVTATVPGLANPVVTATSSTPFSDFHGGVHIRFPIKESPIVPYAVFGIGGLTHFQRTASLSYVGIDGARHTLSQLDPSGTDFAVNFGGGVRYYLGQRFGFRVEAKAYKPNSSFTSVFGKVELGVFYQFR